MRRRIPSTIALSVFESAARHGKFSLAADELCITESAVSRQISTLEDYLGVKLFSRSKKQVTLNDAGKAYILGVGESLSQIEAQTLAIMAHKGEGQLIELAVIPTFASLWLLPLLHDFHARHPGIVINLSQRPEPFSFTGTRFDAAINFDHPSWVNVVKIDLFEEELVPIVSPGHFEASLLTQPSDLMRIPLLYKKSCSHTWDAWFTLAGSAAGPPSLSMRFDLYGMLIDAVRAGLGAGLVPRFYVREDLATGRLSVPFDIALRHEKRYALVYPDHKRDSPAVQAFRDWLVEVSEKFASSIASPDSCK